LIDDCYRVHGYLLNPRLDCSLHLIGVGHFG
jgi:hypothetical protein